MTKKTMSFLRPKNPLVKALFAVVSAFWYVFVWRRDRKQGQGKIVDAKGTVIEEKK